MRFHLLAPFPVWLRSCLPAGCFLSRLCGTRKSRQPSGLAGELLRLENVVAIVAATCHHGLLTIRSFGDCSQVEAAQRALGALPLPAPGKGGVGVRAVPCSGEALALQAPG